MLQPGLEFQEDYLVEQEMLAQTVGSGDLPVLATPTLLAKLENAAMRCVAPQLAQADTTVGGYIELKHLRPTAAGKPFTVHARLEAVSGKKLTFRLQATDDQGVIGEGKHLRFIVQRKQFLTQL